MPDNDHYCNLLSGHFYHVYNRANGNEKIFFQQRNYNYFLRRYNDLLSDYADTYAYSLLQNHFYLLLRVKSEDEILAAEIKRNVVDTAGQVSEVVSEQFRRLFISYSKSINIQEQRNGSLFQRKFRRKLVDHPKYFRFLVYYIHHQPSHHGYDIEDLDYPHSSYQSFLTEKKSRLMRSEVLNWFGGKNNFEKFHPEQMKVPILNSFTIEEE